MTMQLLFLLPFLAGMPFIIDPGIEDDPLGPGITPPGPDFGSILASIAAVISAVIVALQKVWAALIALTNWALGIFRKLGTFLRHMWENILKQAIWTLYQHVLKLYAWLSRHLKAVIAQMQKWKKWYDTHILPQQLRMYAMIQQIRTYLSVLRLFAPRLAAQLDAKLAGIQNKIAEVIDVTRGTLNNVINLLGAILDPRLLFRRNAIGASLLANVGLLKRITDWGSSRPLFASEAATMTADHNRFLTSNVLATVRQRLASGPTADDQATSKEAQQALIEATTVSATF